MKTYPDLNCWNSYIDYNGIYEFLQFLASAFQSAKLNNFFSWKLRSWAGNLYMKVGSYE